ncbi:PARP7S [Mytilus edulis]|uniref:PARP7S n=1 Tax=Mytilus edulis TaxID=6550 RepID=A0A8S3UKU1_MYTED|nr:PARP7S [Mytilus edulis]
MDWRNTEVEVDLPNGACYQASIKDITESGILVVFKDDLKPETSIKFEKVRLLSHQGQENSDFKQGDIIQVYSKADEDTIEGWWKAKIQVLKGDNCYIEYIDRDGMDLVKKDNIRPVNQRCEEDGIHSEFIKHSGVLAVIYSPISSSLIFVDKKKHTETFMVTSDLMGFAIGTKGANIKKAEHMKGIGSVTKVECDDGYRFKISGRIIGKAGKAIDEIIDKSMVNKIIRRNRPDGVVFNIIGTPESVEKAKILLNFKLDALKNTFSSKTDVKDTERSEVLSDDENSSDFIGVEQTEQMFSQQDPPHRGRGNRAGRAGKGGRGSRLRGGQRGRNNRQQEENTHNQNDMRSNVIQQDVNITTTERNDTYVEIGDSLSHESDSGESSSFSIKSEKHNPTRGKPNRGRYGNRAGRRGRGGRESRFSGGHRGRNNHQQVESTQNHNRSNVTQEDAKPIDRNDEYVCYSLPQELSSDSEESAEEKDSSAFIDSKQQNPNHRQPNRGRFNGNRTRRGGRERPNIGVYQQHEGQSPNMSCVNQENKDALRKYDDLIAGTSQSKQIEVDDNVRSIAFEQSSGGVRHKYTRNNPRAKDTRTSSDEASFPKIKEVGTNRRHQAQVVKIQDSDDELIQPNDGSLSQSSGNSVTQSLKIGHEQMMGRSNCTVRGSGERNTTGSRISGGLRHRHHYHQQKHQMTDDSDENTNSDVEIIEYEYSSLSSGCNDKFSTGEDVTKSLAKFNALLEDKPKPKIQIESKAMKEKRLKEEALDKINEMEILKSLVQRFVGGCSFGSFGCIAYALFPGGDGMKEWFNTRSTKFHIYRDGQEIVYIAPFYKDLNICKHFFNPSKPTFCDNQNCNYFHVCRNFVRGNCRRHHCCFLHDFDSAQNVRIKEKYGLEDFTDSEIIVLLNWKFPRLCPHYIYEQGGCKETDINKEEECPYLHYCKNYFFGKCEMGDGCRYNHSFSDSHNKWVLRSCHLANQNEDALKRMIYVPPNLENHKEQVDAEDYSLDDSSREESLKSTTNQSQKDERRRFKHLSTFKSSVIQPTIQEKMGLRYTLSSESTVTEDTPESDDSLLAEAAGNKHICLALMKKNCPSSVCTDLHLQNGVPYLWQVKIDGEWVSFLPKDNFKIENAYCSLEQNVQIKDIVYSGSICTVHISFEIVDENMYGIVFDATGSSSNRVIVRRLSTPSFGERYLDVDCYLTQWRWYWKNDHGVWLCYDTDLQTYTLEVKFLKQQKTYLFSRENYKQKYRLSFNSMEQVNLEYGTTRVLIRRPLFVSRKIFRRKINSKPAHFYPWDLANEFELVEIVSSFTSEYNDVLSSFQKTMTKGKYEVRSIYRVRAGNCGQSLKPKKKHMHADAEKDNPTFSSIDERSLFHGTDSLDVCRGICINNFDFRKSGKNATVFGEGSYFARDASYSHNYTKASSDFGDRYMFRAKVLVGKFTQGSRTYRRPPEIPGQSHKLYDSCVDHPVDPNIFVIFDRSQSYPEYLINYREKDYGERRISTGTTHSSVSSYPLSTGTSQQPIHQRVHPVSSAYSSGGTSLGVAQKPVQSSMHSASSTAYSQRGTSFGTATRFNSNYVSAPNAPRGRSSGTSSIYNPVSNSASSMGNSSSSSGNQPSSSQNYSNNSRKQDKDCAIL